MKKRLICLLMVCTLLLSILAIAPVQVRAASDMKISEAGIEFIKQWEGFSAKPYKDGNQYTVGYGTKCPDDLLEHYTEVGITEEEALVLLDQMLSTFEALVNAFIDQHELTYTQQQFDAVVALVFNCGGSWLTGGDLLINALANDVSDNELIFAFSVYSMSNGVRSRGHVLRRLTEANIYLNGIYATTPPSNYRYILYDPCGGTLVECGAQGFDADQPVQLFTTATYEGYKFLGWYTEEEGGEKVEILDANIPSGKYLYAHWEAETPPEATTPDSTTPESTTPEATAPETEPPTTIPPTTVPPTTVPPTTVPPTTVPPTTVPTTTAPPTTVPPTTVPPTTVPPTTAPPTTVPPTTVPPTTVPPTTAPPVTTPEPNGGITVSVTNTDVNIRNGPGLGYAVLGKATIQQKLTITATASNDGMLWGQFNDGWISLQYTDYETVKEESQNTVLFSGTIHNASSLNIRENPGMTTNVVGKYYTGDRVDILETKTLGNIEWGRTELGWISLKYVLADGEEAPPEVTQPTEPSAPTTKPPEPPAPTTKPTEPPATKPTEPPATKPSEPTQPTEPSQPASFTMTVNTSSLRIRKGAGLSYAIIDYLPFGEKVDILETKTVGSAQWGRTDAGWVDMRYLK